MASSEQSNFTNSLSGAKERRNQADINCLVSMEKEFSSSFAASSGGFNETSTGILFQVLFPLLVAGLGMVAAGLLLDHSQDAPVFRYVGEIFILVPALLGLKGNLEMTMASRLSSLANMGLLKSNSQRVEVFKANIALTQVRTL